MLNEELSKDVDFKKLLDEEKRARLDNEATKGAILCAEIVKYAFQKRDYESMRYLLASLNKKRNQSREAVTAIVKLALNEIYYSINQDEQIKLLQAIIEITEGRIFVEYEYSVAIRKLTEIHLNNNQVDEASKLIQDIQIETFGSLEKAYKIDYILFQMKILLKKEDYVRTLIVSNKIIRRLLNEEKLEKLKLEFFELMIRYYLHEDKFLEVSKSYKTLYDFVKEIEIKLTNASQIAKETLDNYRDILNNVNKNILFTNYVMFLAICPPELETKNMFNELDLFYKKDLEENSDMLQIVKKKLSDEIIFINDEFLGQFERYPPFIASELIQNAGKHFSLFRKYLIQHNLTIFGKFFSQCRLERMGAMMNINKNEVEAEIADMVINKYIYAKINRIDGTVNFKPKQDLNDKLNDLNFDLSKMLEKVETTCHLIHKENLKYDIK